MRNCVGERAEPEEKCEKLSKSLFPMLNAFILYTRIAK